jgi:hypothetical protein
MKDYSDFSSLNDKKLRTLRNNLNNRLEAFKRNSAGHLPPSHMLHGLDEAQCRALLERVKQELVARASA